MSPEEWEARKRRLTPEELRKLPVLPRHGWTAAQLDRIAKGCIEALDRARDTKSAERSS